MDIEKLIEQLGENTDCWTDKVHGYADLRLEASTALSTLQAENEKLRAELEQVKAERGAAVADMEALMWFSGEGCRICAHAVEVHKEPYVRLDCDREKGTDCSPKWRGVQNE